MCAVPNPEDIHAAAEAAASVRFQPAEDTHVCPACYHPPHWGGMCGLCLCFKVHGRGAQCPYGDSTCPCPDGDMCHYEGPDPMSPPSGYTQAVDEPVDRVLGRHRREVPKSSKLARLRRRMFGR